MYIASDSFPWTDFWRFFGLLVASVATPIILLSGALAMGVVLSTVIERLQPKTAKNVRIATIASFAILPPLIAYWILPANIAVVAVALTLMGSVCFAIVVSVTERESTNSVKPLKKDW